MINGQCRLSLEHILPISQTVPATKIKGSFELLQFFLRYYKCFYENPRNYTFHSNCLWAEEHLRRQAYFCSGRSSDLVIISEFVLSLARSCTPLE